MPAERLDELMRHASAEPGSPAVRLERLTRAVRAEQPDTRDGTPWGWVAGGAAGLLLVGAVLARSRIREATP
jgi:hypothetical protein